MPKSDKLARADQSAKAKPVGAGKKTAAGTPARLEKRGRAAKTPTDKPVLSDGQAQAIEVAPEDRAAPAAPQATESQQAPARQEAQAGEQAPANGSPAGNGAEPPRTVSRPAVGDDHRNLGMLALRVPADDRAVRDAPVTVIVSGVGRSGTSMVAKVLDALGLPMGKTDGLEVFEDQEFIKALVSFDYNHMRQIISDYDAVHRRWGFKFASLQNHVFPPQLAHFRNPRLIIVSRDPVATASRSHVSDPDKKGIEETLLNVAKQISDMINFVRSAECPTLLVSYEKFISFPDRAIDAIAEFCGIVVSDETRNRARHAVEPNNPKYIKLFHPSHHGNFDAVERGVAIGWCAEHGREEPVTVELLADGAVVTSATADIFRSDLLAAGIGTGRHGFRLDVSSIAEKPDAILQIRTVGSGYMIYNSGRSLKDMSAG